MARRKLRLPASYTLALAPDQSLVAALGRRVAIADLRSGTRIGSWNPLGDPAHAAFSADASRLAVKNTSGAIAVLRPTDGEVIARCEPCDEGSNIQFSARDEYLVDGAWSGSIRVRSAATLALEAAFGFPTEMIKAVASSPDCKLWIFVHHPRDTGAKGAVPRPYASLWNWPLASPHASAVLGVDIVRTVSLSPCGTRLAVAGHDRALQSEQLRILDLEGNLLHSRTLPAYAKSPPRWSRSGRLLGIAAGSRFHVFAVASLEMHAEFAADYPSDLAFIDDDASILLGTWKSGWIAPLPEMA